jgi:hypothetical protein
LRVAYQSLQQSRDAGLDHLDDGAQVRVGKELDVLTQRMFSRWDDARLRAEREKGRKG